MRRFTSVSVALGCIASAWACNGATPHGAAPGVVADAGAPLEAGSRSIDAQPANADSTTPGAGPDSATVDVDASPDAPASTDGNPGLDSGLPSQGSCTAGAVRCAAGNVVESCNASGTAWLYEETCAACSAGLCTGACTPGAARCNGTNVETCNAGGTAFATTAACTTFCSTASNACALPTTQVTAATPMDGVVVVDGDLDVYPGATVTSATGSLTIYANTITVQQGGSIVVSATGARTDGAAVPGPGVNQYAGAGGGYGGPGQPTAFVTYGSPGPAFGSADDSDVAQGGPGASADGTAGGLGGGVLRLFAKTITVAGQLRANGAGGAGTSNNCGAAAAGGGAGGGILLAANDIELTGSASAEGGAGGGSAECQSFSYGAGAGGPGRIKLLAPTVNATGTLGNAVVTRGLLPPIPVTSSSHPDPGQTYNDNFATLDFSWSQPFPGVQGYYVLAGTSSGFPTPASAQFVPTEYASFPESIVPAYDDDGGADAGPGSGAFTFEYRIVSVAASSLVGAVETVFPVHINASPPTVTSSSHPDPTAWSSNANPYFSWTFPVADSALTSSYYVLDHYGNTVPSIADTMVPIAQKNLLLGNIGPGVWVLHVVSVDTRGYFTKVAGSYRVNIGTDPGSGALVGQVVDSATVPVPNATVTLNRGLYTTTTNASGTYNFSAVPAGTWEVSATAASSVGTVSAAVTSGGTATANLGL